ncbi:hypothetical protein MHBO_004447, partial [Bonamia ostreae]
METVGLDFAGGLCTSTNIEYSKINDFKCAPNYVLLIRDHFFQSDSGGNAISGSYFRPLEPNDPSPTVCFVGGSSDCVVKVDSIFDYLSPICVNMCRLKIEESLMELRRKYRLAIGEWREFRRKDMNKACCDSAEKLQKVIRKGLHLVCANGYERKNPKRSLGVISHVSGSRDCSIERKVMDRLTVCG